MKKLIVLFVSIVFLLAACSLNSSDKFDTTENASESESAPHTTQLSGGSTTSVYDRPIRMRGDYDSVPTVTQPAPLSADERTIVKIHTSKNDPYSYVVKDHYEYLLNSAGIGAANEARYFLYDIDGNGSEELIFGQVRVLGGMDVYDVRLSTDEVPPVMGILIVDIYSIVDGKASRQKQMVLGGGAAYETQILSNGIVKISYNTPALPSYSYYSFADSVGSYIGSLKANRDGTFTYVDSNVANQAISKDEFDRRIAEIEDGAHPIEIEWKRLQDYGK